MEKNLVIYRYVIHNFRVVQVSSASATFGMTFSSSMSVVEYYLLKRFPVPYGESVPHNTQIVPHKQRFLGFFLLNTNIHHFDKKARCTTSGKGIVIRINFTDPLQLFVAALYFVGVATIAAFIGQHIIRKLVILLGRASLIIFILAFTIFVSAVSLGEHYCFLSFGPLKYNFQITSKYVNLNSEMICICLLGGVGISNMIGKIQRHEYMGFDNLCKYEA